jgi:hypothetical protein
LVARRCQATFRAQEIVPRTDIVRGSGGTPPLNAKPFRGGAERGEAEGPCSLGRRCSRRAMPGARAKRRLPFQDNPSVSLAPLASHLPRTAAQSRGGVSSVARTRSTTPIACDSCVARPLIAGGAELLPDGAKRAVTGCRVNESVCCGRWASRTPGDRRGWLVDRRTLTDPAVSSLLSPYSSLLLFPTLSPRGHKPSLLRIRSAAANG